MGAMEPNNAKPNIFADAEFEDRCSLTTMSIELTALTCDATLLYRLSLRQRFLLSLSHFATNFF